MSERRIFVALDHARADDALELAGRLEPSRCGVKVGKELFTRAGPPVVSRLAGSGFELFLDLKFHDIPATVAGACRAAAALGAAMLDVHALGGRKMMEAAREALARENPRPLLVAVTLLTSLDAGALREIGLQGTPEQHVLGLTRLAIDCGLDGVVCSAAELDSLRGIVPPGFRLVTPGIRPRGAPAADQARVATPADALRRGATDLVIGRPITAAPDPLAALRDIEAEVAGA